jgi:A/G-specific adenine glycosylase
MKNIASSDPTPLLVPLIQWFSEVRRPFPWREVVSPYRVLVSEIMLQQTQAIRVIPFFSRWMELFPTPHSLAFASEETVIKAWEGLGYYSRARALHKAAQIIVAKHEGEVPNNEKALLSLPGIGPYTAGAIRAFAFHERTAAVDANVFRVMTRLMAPLPRASMPVAVKQLLPQERPWHTMEALIELGALVCKPTPSCSACPLANQCHAFASNTQEERPGKRCVQKTALWRDVAIFLSQGNALVTHRTGKQVMNGLYEFPYFDTCPRRRSSSAFIQFLQPLIPSRISFIASLPSTSHSFTRFRATLYPTLISCEKTFAWHHSQWEPIKNLRKFPFSSGHRRILEAFLDVDT